MFLHTCPMSMLVPLNLYFGYFPIFHTSLEFTWQSSATLPPLFLARPPSHWCVPTKNLLSCNLTATQMSQTKHGCWAASLILYSYIPRIWRAGNFHKLSDSTGTSNRQFCNPDLKKIRGLGADFGELSTNSNLRLKQRLKCNPDNYQTPINSRGCFWVTLAGVFH